MSGSLGFCFGGKQRLTFETLCRDTACTRRTETAGHDGRNRRSISKGIPGMTPRRAVFVSGLTLIVKLPGVRNYERWQVPFGQEFEASRWIIEGVRGPAICPAAL